MNTFKWLGAFILLVALGIGGFSMAVAAATAPPELPNEPATLTVESAGVQIKHSGDEAWTNATNGLLVTPGDSLKTDGTGSAEVNLFDQGVIRLDHDTQITLTDALWDENNPEVFLGSIFLSTGRLWSRLFDFVSPDSAFNVRTESTVATVRGTVFSVSALPNGEAWVYVDDHMVQVKTPDDFLSVVGGEHAKVEKDTDHFKISRQSIPNGAFADWVNNNRGKDVQFSKAVLKRWREKLTKFSSFIKTAEAVRLWVALSPEKKEEFKQRFARRHKFLARLISEMKDEVKAPNTKIVPPEVTTEVTTETTLNVNVTGLPGGTVTIPVTPAAPVPTEPVPAAAPEATPVSLILSAKTTNVTAGSQTTITAILVYSDDSRMDVSKDVNWDVLPDVQGYTAGRMVSNIFVAGDRGGVANVQGIYTTATGRFIENIAITVTAPAALLAPLY